eukprot:gene26610-biopygen16994
MQTGEALAMAGVYRVNWLSGSVPVDPTRL